MDLDSGTKVVVTIRLAGWPVHSETFELCDVLLDVACPVTRGASYTGELQQFIPAVAPHDITVGAQVEAFVPAGAQDRAVSCLMLKVTTASWAADDAGAAVSSDANLRGAGISAGGGGRAASVTGQ